MRDLIERGNRRAAADDVGGAMDDFDVAEQQGAAPDLLAAARLALAERQAGDVQSALEAGDPARVCERVDALGKRHVSAPVLRRFREAAGLWADALEDMRRGEFGRAREGLDRAGRTAGGLAADALAAARKDLELRQQQAQPRIENLYKALAEHHDGGHVLAAAESVLELVPEHPAARQARARAWQQIGALSPGASLPARPAQRAGLGIEARPAAALEQAQTRRAVASGDPPIVYLDESAPRDMHAREPREQPRGRTETGPNGRLLLWVDAVGGYLICLDQEVVIGRAGHDSLADIPLLADLSRRHASVIRQGDSYVIRAWHPTYVNERPVVGTAPLRDRDLIRLGSTVELSFRQPSPVSATARLEVESRHRLPLAVEGVILMAETCILGPPPQSHLSASSLATPVVLFRHDGRLWCRTSAAMVVDGRNERGRVPLKLTSHVQGDGFSFCLEPLLHRT